MSEEKENLKRYINRAVKKCEDCKKNPAIFILISTDVVGVCRKHWRRIAYMKW
ncbi:MAG: hypothetical protein QXT67_04850 [Candidatus Bathyarchaeia archaeon]